MSSFVIIGLFFLVLASLLSAAARKETKKERIAFAIGAFAWSCLMYSLAGWVHSLNYNIWYSNATDQLLEASVQALEEGREDQLLNEIRTLKEKLVVTYETKGDYPEQVRETVGNLAIAPNQTEQDNPITRP